MLILALRSINTTYILGGKYKLLCRVVAPHGSRCLPLCERNVC